DGSLDNTYLMAKEILERSGFINYKIINKENTGVSASRNIGMQNARGKYVLFLDADDYLSLDAVEIVEGYINTHDVDVICWGFNVVNEHKSVINNYFDNYTSNLSNMSGEEALRNVTVNEKMWICTGSAIFRKDFLVKNGLNYTVGCINGEDLEFTYKIL